jgi:hypothetical protein
MPANSPNKRKLHYYTADQLDWLRELYPQMPCKPLTRLFNETFRADITSTAMHGTLLRYKIASGRTGRFEKGLTPYNKGMTGLRHSPATEFKKGSVPASTRPVGSEQYRSDGYIWVKIAEPRTWRQKHVFLWEQHHGHRPPGHAIIFKDQNRENISLDNLLLVDRKLLLRINKNNYAKMPDPIKPSVIAYSKLELKIIELRST